MVLLPSGWTIRLQTLLCLTAEQTYLATLHQRFGSNGDSYAIRQYDPKPVKGALSHKVQENVETFQLILDVMKLANLVAAAEAHLNDYFEKFYQLVNYTARASKLFEKNPMELPDRHLNDAEKNN